MSTDHRVVCIACGAINRVPADRPASAAKCGSCGEALFAGKPADVSGAVLDRQISKGTLPVVVDVWAPWCGPCRAMAPQYEAAARSLEPVARFLKLNSDVESTVASRLNIRSIPTMILFQGGRELDRVSGGMSSAQIGNWIRTRIS
jgi:thioredoxin 2